MLAWHEMVNMEFVAWNLWLIGINRSSLANKDSDRKIHFTELRSKLQWRAIHQHSIYSSGLNILEPNSNVDTKLDSIQLDKA